MGSTSLMKYFLIIWLLSLAQITNGQRPFDFDKNDTNQTNHRGKKHGIWIAYLSETVSPCDKEQAFYYGYELYDNGKSVFKFNNYKWRGKGKIECKRNCDTTERPMLINGTFEWYDETGRFIVLEEYKEGKPQYFTGINYDKKEPDKESFVQHFYYDKLWGGLPGTFYYESFSWGQLFDKGFYRKGHKGWDLFSL